MEDFYEHIDDYKSGSLESDALALFEAELKQNTSLRIAVDNYEAARSISESLLEEDMLQTLQRLTTENPQFSHSNEVQSSNPTDATSPSVDKSKQHRPIPEKTNDRSENKKYRLKDNHNLSPDIDAPSHVSNPSHTAKRFSFRRLAIAASIVGLLCVGSWQLMDYQADQERLAYVLANYIEPVDDDATKSVDTVGMSPFEKGKYLYSLNRFEESAEWLELVVAQEKDKTLVSKGYYWLGCAYLNMKMLDEAEQAWRMSSEEQAVKGLELFS